jgi:hypothetical protein
MLLYLPTYLCYLGGRPIDLARAAEAHSDGATFEEIAYEAWAGMRAGFDRLMMLCSSTQAEVGR